MSKKSAPTAPTAPDPAVVAKAQSDANIASATAQQRLNMINTNGPGGSVSYAADASAPGGYSQNTTLSAGQQGIYDQGVNAQNAALGVANQQIGRVGDALSQTLNTRGLPGLSGGVSYGGFGGSNQPPPSNNPLNGTMAHKAALGATGAQGAAPSGPTSYGDVQTSFDKGGPLQYGFDPGQDVQGHVGPTDFNQAAGQAANAVYGQATSRLDPQWNTRQSQLETQLANQGLSQNSDAYKNAAASFGRDRNDAYNQANFSAIGAGQNEQNTLFNQALNQGQFANSAAAQQYAQNQGQAAFNNTTAGQDYAQNLGAAQFANTAQQQKFGQGLQGAQFALQNAQFGNQARQQGLQEQAYIQNQPLNQFNSLMSSSQVSMPQGINYTPSQVGQTDVTGAYALNQQAQNTAYQGALANQQSKLGGLYSLGSALGSAAIFASDIRLKRDVELLAREDDGLGVWRYRYLWDEEPRVGVMAHEVAELRPHALRQSAHGFLMVDYGAL